MFYTFTSALPAVCEVSKVAAYCISLISSCPGPLVRYFMNDLEVVPIADIITSFTFTLYIPHALYCCCKFFIF